MSRSRVLGAFLKLLLRPNLFSIHKTLLKSAIGGKFVLTAISVLKKSGWLVYPKGGFCRIENVHTMSKKLSFDKKKYSLWIVRSGLLIFEPTPIRAVCLFRDSATLTFGKKGVSTAVYPSAMFVLF
jgi:hypothetical protein